MTARKESKQFYIVVGVIALALLAGGWFTYATRRGKLNALQATLTAKRTEIKNLEPEIARRPQLEAEYGRLQERLAMLEPTLPNYAYVPTLLRQLERLANQTNNKIDAIKPQRSRAKSTAKKPPSVTGSSHNKDAKTLAATQPTVPYDSVDIDVELQGSYWTTIKFLEQLQKFPKMLAINEMALRPSCAATTAGSPRLGVQITVKALVAKGE